MSVCSESEPLSEVSGELIASRDVADGWSGVAPENNEVQHQGDSCTFLMYAHKSRSPPLQMIIHGLPGTASENLYSSLAVWGWANTGQISHITR